MMMVIIKKICFDETIEGINYNLENIPKINKVFNISKYVNQTRKISLVLQHFPQSILSSSLIPTLLSFSHQMSSNIIPFHVVCHLSMIHDIFYHLTNKMFQFHVFYHLHIDLNIFYHPSTLFFLHHAFYCSAIVLHTFYFCTKHKHLS